VYQHRDFGDWRIHPVEQAEFKWERNLPKALRPIGLDLASLDVLRASGDLRQPLALDCCRDVVVPNPHSLQKKRIDAFRQLLLI
jgi:hypothetical protein